MVIYRLFTAGEYDKREKWVNEMCKKGYALKHFGIVKYEFEKCKPDEYYYCLELFENLPSHPDHEDYINFLRDEWKIEYVDSDYNWAFFRRKRIDGKFSLFSTKEAKIAYFKRILTFRISITSLLLLLSITNILLSPSDSSDIIFSILGILFAIFIFVANVPNFIKLYKLKNSSHSDE